VWWETLWSKDSRLHPESSFEDLANVTIETAKKLENNGRITEGGRDHIQKAWIEVGVLK